MQLRIICKNAKMPAVLVWSFLRSDGFSSMDTINFGEIDLTAISYYYSKTLVLHTRENWYKKYVEAVDHFAKGLFLAPTVAFFRPLELLQL